MKMFDMNNLWVIRMIDENFSFFVIGFEDTSLMGRYKVEHADENTTVDCDYIVC